MQKTILNNLPKLLCIVGPTSSGKTSLSLELAKKYKGEIISSDSRQLYSDMNIGTSKIPTDSISPITYEINEKKEKVNAIIHSDITHYMIDVCKPNEDFSVSQFKETSVKLIQEINQRGKLAIMAGGTGLYVNSVTDNLLIPEIPANMDLRSELEKKNKEELYKIFQDLNISGSKTIDKDNKRRLIRAIEVLKHSPTNKSVLKKKGPVIFDILMIGIDTPREIIYDKINRRIDKIFGDDPSNSPMIKETKELISKYNHKECTPLQGLGYKQAIWYLENYPSPHKEEQPISYDEAKTLAKQAERNYAKRQLTWFRKDKNIKWIPHGNVLDESVRLIDEWIIN